MRDIKSDARKAFQIEVIESKGYSDQRDSNGLYVQKGLQSAWRNFCSGYMAAPDDAACLSLVVDMRWACGDNGKRMQDELVAHIADISKKAEMWERAQSVSVPEGLERSALYIEHKAANYDLEHGTTDPSTGSREYPGDGAEYYSGMMELAEDIRALKTTPAKADGWIKCSERLPNERVGCLISNPESDCVLMAMCVAGLWFTYDGELEPVSEVTHWMPLPETPKEIA